MKISRFVLAAALAAAWAALPPAVRAEEGEGYHGDRGDERGGVMRGHHEGMGRNGGDPVMREKFEKLRELEKKTHEIAKNMRQGSDAEKAAAKSEARKTLGELFDAKLAMETAMLDKMEKRAAELKAKIEKKKSSREKAIESRLSRMSGEGDDWD